MASAELFAKYKLFNFYLGDDLIYNRDFATPLWQQQNELLNASHDILPQGRRFLASGLHDSEVSSINRDTGSLTIKLEEFKFIEFYWAFKDATKLRGPFPKFPVSLEFENIEKLAVYKMNHNGKFLPVNKEKWLKWIDEYIYDHIAQLTPSCIEIALVMFSSKMRSYIIVEIKAERLNITENHQDIFEKRIAKEHLPLFDKFIKLIDQGEYFDASVAGNFIKNNL